MLGNHIVAHIEIKHLDILYMEIHNLPIVHTGRWEGKLGDNFSMVMQSILLELICEVSAQYQNRV